ncbi:hypothetical protein AgCh_039968 [Apium graveolens]
MGYVLRVRLASFFAGAAVASMAGLYTLHNDYTAAHQSISHKVEIFRGKASLFAKETRFYLNEVLLILSSKDLKKYILAFKFLGEMNSLHDSLNGRISALEKLKEMEATKQAEATKEVEATNHVEASNQDEVRESTNQAQAAE